MLLIEYQKYILNPANQINVEHFHTQSSIFPHVSPKNKIGNTTQKDTIQLNNNVLQ